MDYELVEPNSPRWLSLEDLPNERWKDIEGYEGLYQISDYGRVKSLERYTNNQYGKLQIKKITYDKHYFCVTLVKHGVHKRFNVHVLVAKYFIPNPNNYPQVLHKKAVSDGGTNYANNLYWGTQKDNMQDRKRDGHFEFSQETRNKLSEKSSKSVVQFTKDGKFVKIYKSARDVERKTGIKNNNIGSCCKGKRKSIGGYKWKYYEEVKDELEI